MEPLAPDPRYRGVRLLLLGESHYEQPSDGLRDASGRHSTLTKDVVERWGREPEGRQVFFANIYSMLTGSTWNATAPHKALWDNVFFYNYVQTLVPNGPRNRPTRKMFETSHEAFREVLERIRPDGLLVLGKQLWQSMTPEDRVIGDSPEGLDKICAYRLRDGKEILAAHTDHPSSYGFRASDWSNRVAVFLEYCTDHNANA